MSDGVRVVGGSVGFGELGATTIVAQPGSVDQQLTYPIPSPPPRREQSVDIDGTLQQYFSTLSSGSLDITGSFTVEFYVKPVSEPVATTWGFLGDVGPVSFTRWRAGWLRSGGGFVNELTMTINGISATNVFNSNKITSFVSGSWEHVAIVVDAENTFTTCSFYKGLVNVGTEISNIGALDTSLGGEIHVGRTATENWFGGLDEVRIWRGTRTLSQLSASATFVLDPSVEQDLLAYWRFSETGEDELGDHDLAQVNGPITFVDDFPFIV